MWEIRDLWERLLDHPQIGSFLRDNQDILKKIGIITGIVLVITISFVMNKSGEEPIVEDEQSVVAEETVSDYVVVDVGGEVKNPTVVQLEDGSRVDDAIKAAGGLTDDADLTNINRAAFVNDGDKIYVPAQSENTGAIGSITTSGNVSSVSDGKVNINTADAEQLQSLTGVGPATADKIIDYRENNGRFTSVEDIKKVSGIGDKTYEKLKDSIRV